MTEFELNKNKSKRIIALALEAYFINGISPIEFITNHRNIYDFCIAKKAYKELHYEEIISGYDKGKVLLRPSWDPTIMEEYVVQDRSKEEVVVHKKLIRYYVAKNGNIMMKRGKDFKGKAVNNHCEAIDSDFPWMGQPKVKYFNRAVIHEDFAEYDVDCSYYILDVCKRIDAIMRTKLAKNYTDEFKTKQIALF